MSDKNILLTTLNAQYIHSSFALRYLFANLYELKDCSTIREYTTKDSPLKIVEEILDINPQIIGFSVYIWNTHETKNVIRILQQVRPDIVIVLGGPEVSYESNEQPIVQIADYVVIGEGEISFYNLCKKLLSGKQPKNKLVIGPAPDVATMEFPYSLYSDFDIANRVLYVEASRGCPFRCQFCLSSLDKKVRNFPLETFLQQMQNLLDRGARQFKFIDRTFNLSPNISTSILKFFLDQNLADLFLHFEMIPDRFPKVLREWIIKFPPGSIQFEVGIQSLNSEVTERIQRKQNNTKALENLHFLNQTGIHLHTDLIAGLPGEDLQSFARGFDQLIGMDVEEIQVGILKRLRGTPITSHSKEWEVIFSPDPPYEILQNKLLSFSDISRIRKFARYWNIIGNSGRFKYLCSLFRKTSSPFNEFMKFSDWLFAQSNQTHKISYQNMLRYLIQYFTTVKEHSNDEIIQLAQQDYADTTGKKNPPHFLKSTEISTTKKNSGTQRQRRHQK
jgi:radical SAM superfamily enzyme YgiQ (UPF0313 family)